MSQRRVYTGAQRTVFKTGGVGEVVPGAEFDVPDEFLASFDARPDVGAVPRRAGRRSISDAGEPSLAAPGDGD